MNPELKRIILFPFNILYKIRPSWSLKLLFLIKLGYPLNLKKPKTFNEKINWLKLNYRNELMPKCADKYKVRNYITDNGYGELLPKLLWHGFDARDIPFEDLPSKFVIKVTHG